MHNNTVSRVKFGLLPVLLPRACRNPCVNRSSWQKDKVSFCILLLRFINLPYFGAFTFLGSKGLERLEIILPKSRFVSSVRILIRNRTNVVDTAKRLILILYLEGINCNVWFALRDDERNHNGSSRRNFRPYVYLSEWVPVMLPSIPAACQSRPSSSHCSRVTKSTICVVQGLHIRQRHHLNFDRSIQYVSDVFRQLSSTILLKRQSKSNCSSESGPIILQRRESRLEG